MADDPPVSLHSLLMQMQMGLHRRHETHQDLCETLKRQGALASPEVIRAFEAVDRRHFLSEGCQDEAYVERPVKLGHLHQSAPSIYAQALEALDLRPGLSFLNVGSGTGYFSALVAQITGPRSLNVGVERHGDLVRHAREKCAALGLDQLQFHCGSCFRIEVESSMKFDRIYVGAGAPVEAKFLFKLLKYDGIIVGPFDSDGDDFGGQCLIKARCRGGKKFAVSQLMQVQFAALVRAEGGNANEGDADDLTPIVLRGPRWSAETRALFPESFHRVVMLLYWSTQMEGTMPSRLPWELWSRYIISMLPFDAFEREPVQAFCAGCGKGQPATQCGKCKAAFYCGRDCQKSHWAAHKESCKAACGGA